MPSHNSCESINIGSEILFIINIRMDYNIIIFGGIIKEFSVFPWKIGILIRFSKMFSDSVILL